MKLKLLDRKNAPYLISWSGVLAGAVLFICGRLSAEPVAGDPDIGASLIELVGVLVVIGGILGSIVTFVLRKLAR